MSSLFQSILRLSTLQSPPQLRSSLSFSTSSASPMDWWWPTSSNERLLMVCQTSPQHLLIRNGFHSPSFSIHFLTEGSSAQEEAETGLQPESCWFLLCGNALNFRISTSSSTERRIVPWAIVVEGGGAERKSRKFRIKGSFVRKVVQSALYFYIVVLGNPCCL